MVQSWPKVLRMTQILPSTKFAASVSLDIFVRCYYGILKYNYKHFMSVKGFYWQLHEIDAKSQYLQCWPFFFKTSAIRSCMLSINVWATSCLMAAYSCIINAWSFSEFVGFCLSTRFLRIDHKFSMGLRSGESPLFEASSLLFELYQHDRVISSLVLVNTHTCVNKRINQLVHLWQGWNAVEMFLGIQFICMAKRDFAINCNSSDHFS